MAVRYVRSGATGAADGTTWADAYTTLADVAAVDTAGDTIYVAEDHAESTAANISLALAGTSASPTKIICANDAAEPPTALSAAGVVTTTGSSNIIISGANCYIEGLTFNISTGSTNNTFQSTGSTGGSAHFKNCNMQVVTTGSGARIHFSAGSRGVHRFENVGVKFAHASQGIGLNASGTIRWIVGSLISGTTSPTALFVVPAGGPNIVLCQGIDLVQGAAGMHIFTAGFSGSYVIRNSKLPSGWSGSLVTGTIGNGERYEMYNCDAGDVNYAMQVTEYAGSIIQEDVIVRTGGAGASSGLYNSTTELSAISWKMISNTNSEYPHITLDSPEIVQWNDTTGSAVTATVEIVTDNVTLTDAECWLEVQYLGTSGFPLGSFISDAKADVLATAANQATSSETWTTTGLTTPVKQKLSVTFTPQERGFVHAVVKLCKAGSTTTVYVDPKLTIA